MSTIRISRIREIGKLSPSNFKESLFERSTLKSLRSFLNEQSPYTKGIEPGRGAYNPAGKQRFLRNSCIDSGNVTQSSSRYERFVGNASERARLRPYDILLCKDANIGDACMYLDDGLSSVFFSSGIVKLNFARDEDRLSCLAMIRSPFFRQQLDAITPRGSTIRHAGELFLDCLLPDIQAEEIDLRDGLDAAIKNIAHCETLCDRKISQASDLISSELLSKPYIYRSPRIAELIKEKRLDAGFYSEVVTRIEESVSAYSGGCQSISEFGFEMKRGPNLQKRDMGRSIQRKTAAAGYHALVYPSDISERGYIEDVSYIGARSLVWHIAEGGVLFSAEGTVGRTFAVCDGSLAFITNIHGLIFSPTGRKSNEKSAFLCMYFHFLKRQGFFDKVSVGGQGGSFAVGYWNKVRVPIFNELLLSEIAKLYHCPAKELVAYKFNLSELEAAGVYELSLFRMVCSDFIERSVAKLLAPSASSSPTRAGAV